MIKIGDNDINPNHICFITKKLGFYDVVFACGSKLSIQPSEYEKLMKEIT